MRLIQSIKIFVGIHNAKFELFAVRVHFLATGGTAEYIYMLMD